MIEEHRHSKDISESLLWNIIKPKKWVIRIPTLCAFFPACLRYHCLNLARLCVPFMAIFFPSLVFLSNYLLFNMKDTILHTRIFSFYLNFCALIIFEQIMWLFAFKINSLEMYWWFNMCQKLARGLTGFGSEYGHTGGYVNA